MIIYFYFLIWLVVELLFKFFFYVSRRRSVLEWIGIKKNVLYIIDGEESGGYDVMIDDNGYYSWRWLRRKRGEGKKEVENKKDENLK